MRLLKTSIIIIFLIISMGFVSAQDDLNDTLQTDEIASFSDLENDIYTTNGTLEITRDYRNDNYTDGITIVDGPLVINGNNHVLDGNGQAIFYNNISDITINNLIFANADYSSIGAAFYNRGNAILNNVTFINNHAGYGGGAICNGEGVMFLNNVTFINNSAYNCGGAIYNFNGTVNLDGGVFINNSVEYGIGGAIANNGEFTLNEGVFINNSANFNGGAIVNGGEFTLNEGVFINNSANSSGGAIANDGEFTLNEGVFINNSANSSGGAITNHGQFALADGVFIYNSAAGSGGAIYNLNNYMASDNCTFINNSAQISGAIDNFEGVLDLNRGVFINNSAVGKEGGAIGSNGYVNCKKSKFINNAAYRGCDFRFISVPMVVIEDCCFESTHHDNYGSIWAIKSNLYVDNSSFANFTANYAGGIFGEFCNLTVNNTQFVNMKANQTAGAVALRSCDSIVLENSNFINTSAVKNGGALFLDIMGYDFIDGVVILSNLSFINSSGNFGGAFVQLGGKLNMSGITFINCTSKYDGGAAYLSNVSAVMDNVSFVGNRVLSYEDYPTYGGAMYFDYGELKMSNSRFIANSAFTGSGAICIYDSLYEISDSTFDNCSEAIHVVFKREGSRVINCSGNVTVSDGNVFYPQMIASKANNLTLLTNELKVDTLPISFDLRDFNWVSPVKSQGYKGYCWMFATAGALESALLKSSGLSMDISEDYGANSMLIYSKYGTYMIEGGFTFAGPAYFLSWLGPIGEELYGYDEIGKISPIFSNSSNIHIQDMVISLCNDEIDKESALKRTILEYGAIYCDIAAAASQGEFYEFYNEETFSQYTPYNSTPNHAICVVGWDDTFSRDNFNIVPPGDGAWICKNSWGTDYGDGGYFYLSYYDKTILSDSYEYKWAFGFLFENTVNYNKNYQYDFTGPYQFNSEGVECPSAVTYANTFVSEDDDLIAAVGTYFNQSGINYTINIKVNGASVLAQKGVSPYCGYRTIKLNDYVSIAKGDNFTVYVTSNALPLAFSRIHCLSNASMSDYFGNWTDLNANGGAVACVKAYTVDDDSEIVENQDVSVDYNGGKYFSVKVATDDGHAVSGAAVKFTINGKTKSFITGMDGIAKIKITEGPGKYTIRISYNGKTCTNKVAVRHVITASKVTVKKTAKKFTLKAKLKINGKLVKGKRITFKFNGKTYKVKTNSKGIAQKTLGKNVIKKLKKGKTYKVKVTYLKDTIKTTVKVSR